MLWRRPISLLAPANLSCGSCIALARPLHFSLHRLRRSLALENLERRTLLSGLSVVTGAADAVSTTDATLHASITPNGQTTKTSFQYSTDPAFTPTAQTTFTSSSAKQIGVAVDAAGDVFLAELDGAYGGGVVGDVWEIPADGSGIQMLASGFGQLFSIAADAAGNVFVADPRNGVIKEIPAGGGAIKTLGAGLTGPDSVAVDAAGDVFVADGGNLSVKEIPADGGAIKTLFQPIYSNGVAVDAAGDVFFLDDENGVVDEIPAGTVETKTLGSGLNQPNGLAVDAAGDVFVADTGNNEVKEIPAGRSVIQSLGSGFQQPTAVAVDAAGDVFVSDSGNRRTVELSPLSVTANPSPLDGTTATAVSAVLTGLTPGTTYYYRAVASSVAGAVADTRQPPQFFTTSLLAGTASASAVGGVEGASAAALTGATFTDVNSAALSTDFSIAAVDWGDGSTDAAGLSISGSAGSFTVAGSHLYAEEGVHNFTLTVKDASGYTATVSGSATVFDAWLAGVATASATGGVEGATLANLAGAFFTDANAGAAPSDFVVVAVDWGDGGADAAGLSISGNAGSFTVAGSHLYAEEGVYNFGITVKDRGGRTATITGSADVADAALAVSAATIAATEDVAFSGTVATFTDPGGPESLSDYSASIDWGDGSSATGGTITEAGGTFTVQGSHTYADHVKSPIHVRISHESAPAATADGLAVVAEDVITAAGVAVNGYEFSPLTNAKVATFTHAGGVEPADEFKTAIDWGDGTSSAGTVSLVSGVYTVSGSHTYTDENSFPVKVTIEDSDAGDAASTSVSTMATILEELLPGGVRSTADQRWISEFYRDLLNRPVDPTGLAYWGGLLAAGESRQRIVLQIESTREFANNEVERLYQRYLHRSADAVGLAYFSNLLEAGKTAEYVSAALASSDEFFSVQGGDTNDGFLDALYRDALGRPLDPTGLAWWSSQLSAGASRTKVVDQIMTAQEYRQDIVNYAYEQLLNRQADTDGVSSWVGRLKAGATDQQVFADIVASQEFYDKTVP